MKIKAGQTCVSCVMYADTNDLQWIISRFEKKQANGNYVVRDVYSETAEYDRYIVPSTHIIPFPLPNEKYEPGDHILALWYDKETKMWSTMFYPATVVEFYPKDHQLLIKYKSSQGAPPNVLIDTSQVSKYPDGYNFHSDDESESDDGKQGQESSSKADQEGANKENAKKDSEEGKKYPPQEEARIRFMNDQKPLQKERPDFKPLTDEDFNELAGPLRKYKPMTTVKGTPLLDFLEDEMLFPKPAPHITGSGILRRKNIDQNPKNPSALLNGPVQCGRINKILHEWK